MWSLRDGPPRDWGLLLSLCDGCDLVGCRGWMIMMMMMQYCADMFLVFACYSHSLNTISLIHALGLGSGGWHWNGHNILFRIG